MKKHSTLIYFVNNFQAENTTKSKVGCGGEDLQTTVDFGPSKRSIENILNFARSYEVLKTESTGYTEMILN